MSSPTIEGHEAETPDLAISAAVSGEIHSPGILLIVGRYLSE
jgi:hypothetical protein